MTKKTAIYVRVSSARQDLRSQESELQVWVKSQSGDFRWYRDKVSGTTMKRPGMDKLLADIASGRINRVVVWRLDRLGRSAAGLMKLFEDLIARKIGLFSLRDSLDLETSSGRLVCHILASVAAYETECRGERQAAGIAAARAAGKRWGGSPKGKRKKVTPVMERTIARMRKDGEKITAIAKTVGTTRHTIYSVLKDLRLMS